MGRHSRKGRAPEEARDPAAADASGQAAARPPSGPAVARPGVADTSAGRQPRASRVVRPGDRQPTPAHGTGVDAAGRGRTRGGHPQAPEPPRPAVGGMVTAAGAQRGGPRQEYLDAFDDPSDPHDDVFAAGAPVRGGGRPAHGEDAGRGAAGPPVAAGPARPGTAAPERGRPAVEEEAPAQSAEPAAPGARRMDGRARAFTGSMAAAVTTVLAVVIAGQVADGTAGDRKAGGTAAAATKRPQGGTQATREHPSGAPSPPSYQEAMSRVYPLDVGLHGPGTFHTVGGHAAGPGGDTELTYRVEVEDDLPLDGELFAEAVQRTVNDERSWAHDHAYSFTRVSSGEPDFVITLASPGTTGVWCAKSGLDTTIQHVSCDSAATPRVMINGWRWAQGSPTFGDEGIREYRQMLVNHEVGHRIGLDHKTCPADGALAPVMMQQTKTLTLDGHTCRPNPWPYPRS